MLLERLFENENLIKMILNDEISIIISTLIRLYPDRTSQHRGVYHGKCKYVLLVDDSFILLIKGFEYIDDYTIYNEGNSILIAIKNKNGEWIIIDDKSDKYSEILGVLEKYIDIYNTINEIYERLDLLYSDKDEKLNIMKNEILKIAG